MVSIDWAVKPLYGCFHRLGVLFWGPCIRDPIICFGSLLGGPEFCSISLWSSRGIDSRTALNPPDDSPESTLERQYPKLITALALP